MYPKASSVKPLLQRMAEEKRFQMERGSIGGSYFMVQLPDGSMEKRMKMPINIDPGVHSSFNLDQLVPGKGLLRKLKCENYLFRACSCDCESNLSRWYRRIVKSVSLFDKLDNHLSNKKNIRLMSLSRVRVFFKYRNGKAYFIEYP